MTALNVSRQYTDQIRIGDTQVMAYLTGLVFKEGETWVSYAPALEISSYGDKIEDAAESLREAVMLILGDLHASGGLDEDLRRLGWLVSAAGAYHKRQSLKRQIPDSVADNYYLRPLSISL
ncbi:MAG: hypothetical protein SF053_08725 [Bacteroidia bacterium]|nr:hypothetical protein [Bacteroidia bacterium]